jgi:hypothetical protein
MVSNTKNQFSYCFIFYFQFCNLFSKRNSKEISRLSKSAQEVSIIRTIGVLLMSTVKPMLMQFRDAQCEDDFKRVEMNYIEKLTSLWNQRTIGFV